MSGLSRLARSYIILLTALALGVVLFSLASLGTNLTLWVVVGIVAIAIAVLDAFPIMLWVVEVTVSDTIKFATVLLYPPPVVILATFLGTLIAEMRIPRPPLRRVFNIAEMTLTWSMGAWVFQTFHQPTVDYFGSIQNILSLILAGLAAFLVNLVLLTIVISLASKLPFRYVLSRNIPQVIRQELSMLSLGVFVAVLWNYNPLAVVLAALPLFIVRHSYKIATQLQEQTREALVALMQVIDERDQQTFDHSERVSHYARSIAEQLDLQPEEIDVIASAGLLHDLGKVGMADDILFNPKRLDPEQRKSAERHAEIGAMLLSKFPLFQKGADLVRHHHEHYDGNGYPDRLKGTAIPLGARILAVADAYQAMTEERPYRHALSQESALAELRRWSGTQFDPDVVQALVQVVSAEGKEKEPIPPSEPVAQVAAE